MQFSNLIMSSSQKDRQRECALPRVDFAAVRKSLKLDSATDATIEEETASALVRAVLFYMTDDRHWAEDDWCGTGSSSYGAMMTITYPVWFRGNVNIGKRVEKALRDALGPNVDVHEIEFDYQDGFSFGDVVCTAVPR